MPGYSRAATVTAIRAFYNFIITALPRLEDPTSSGHIIREPPPDGWPDIDATTLAPLGKNPVVIDLLRHLPYLASDGTGSDVVGPEATRPIRYNGPDVRWCFEKGIIDGVLAPVGAGTVPEHVAVLSGAGRYGSWWLIDTERGLSSDRHSDSGAIKGTGSSVMLTSSGTVTDFIQQERPERSTPDVDSPDYWRAYRTLPVEHSFIEWEGNFRTLEWVAVPDNADDGIMYRYDRMTDEIRDIYRAHGWPDTFRRKECR